MPEKNSIIYTVYMKSVFVTLKQSNDLLLYFFCLYSSLSASD